MQRLTWTYCRCVQPDGPCSSLGSFPARTALYLTDHGCAYYLDLGQPVLRSGGRCRTGYWDGWRLPLAFAGHAAVAFRTATPRFAWPATGCGPLTPAKPIFSLDGRWRTQRPGAPRLWFYGSTHGLPTPHALVSPRTRRLLTRFYLRLPWFSALPHILPQHAGSGCGSPDGFWFWLTATYLQRYRSSYSQPH